MPVGNSIFRGVMSYGNTNADGLRAPLHTNTPMHQTTTGPIHIVRMK
jgi:hypothetical protein